MSTLTDDFLTHGLYLRGWSARTLRTYRQGLATLPPTLTRGTLAAWLVGLRQRGLTPGGINMYARTLNSYLTWLHAEGHTSDRLRIALLPNPPKPLTTFSDGDVKGILRHPARGHHVRTKALLVLLFDTGLRIDEALSLTLEAVAWNSLVIRVKGKGNRERVVPFSPTCRKALWMFCGKHVAGFVFRTRSGCRLSTRNAYRDIKGFCAAAGVMGAHVHPHNTRHYFAVSYLRAGGDIYRLSRLLGHTSITTTSLYLRSITVDQLREAHDRCSPLARLG